MPKILNDAQIQKTTILVDTYKRAAIESKTSDNSYNGLNIHALPGLHEFTASELEKSLAKGSRILDLAAGTGAMSLRLCDMGYDVTATDYVAENFRLHGSVPFFTADLNEDFACNFGQQFDAIMASEIIEHLENPRHFARQCFMLLAPGGKLMLSTPNIDTTASIVSFLRNGTFAWFNNLDYKNEGHITPLTQWQIEKCFVEAGMSFKWRSSFGDPDDLLAGSPRLLILSKLARLITRKGKDLNKQIFVALVEKSALKVVS